MKSKTVLDMCGNQFENAVIENRTTASDNPVKGQFYYNTTTNRLFIYNGSEWVNFNPTEAYTFAKAAEGVLQILRKINDSTAPDVENLQLVDTSQFDPAGSAAQALASAKVYADNKISELVSGAPETLDTLSEVAAALAENEDAINALMAIASAGVHKSKVYCPALTPSSGVCTWVCAHGLTMESSDVICKVYTQSGEEVLCDVTINSVANVIIKIASTETISAGSYYAVFLG